MLPPELKILIQIAHLTPVGLDLSSFPMLGIACVEPGHDHLSMAGAPHSLVPTVVMSAYL